MLDDQRRRAMCPLRPAAGKCLTIDVNATDFCESMNSGDMYPGCECRHGRWQGWASRCALRMHGVRSCLHTRVRPPLMVRQAFISLPPLHDPAVQTTWCPLGTRTTG